MDSRVLLVGVSFQGGAGSLEPKFDEHISFEKKHWYLLSAVPHGYSLVWILIPSKLCVCVCPCVRTCVFACMSASVLPELTILFTDILAGFAFNTRVLLLPAIVFQHGENVVLKNNCWKEKNSVVKLTIRSKINSVKHSWGASFLIVVTVV